MSATLGWLLGEHTRPPIPLPRRNPDCSASSAEHLYREAVEARPHAIWTPERRAAARNQAHTEAARNQRLVARADSVL